MIGSSCLVCQSRDVGEVLTAWGLMDLCRSCQRAACAPDRPPMTLSDFVHLQTIKGANDADRNTIRTGTHPRVQHNR